MLKSISLYMNDFKKIIKNCDIEIAKAKESQKNKWMNFITYIKNHKIILVFWTTYIFSSGSS